MEKIGNQILEDFPPTTLYLDDLTGIVEIFERVCKRLEITAGQYKISERSELPLLAARFPNGRFDRIKIQGQDPYISVDFRPYLVSVYLSEETLEQRGMLSTIRDVVNKGKKRKPEIPLIIFMYVTGSLAVWKLISKEYPIGVAFALISISAIPVGVKYAMKHNVIIHSKLRGEITTFFQRKKDDIVLAGIAALLGGVVTYLFGKFVQ